MGALSNAIKDQQKRRAVVDDGVAAIEAEVASKGGVSGLAVKGAFKVVKGVKPGFTGMVLDHLLDDFAAQVDPFYDAYKASGQSDIVGYFGSRDKEIASALLSVTDARAVRAKNKAIKKAYDKLRPRAVDHVTAAMPRVARLVEKHAS
jgi:hypothetical protein